MKHSLTLHGLPSGLTLVLETSVRIQMLIREFNELGSTVETILCAENGPHRYEWDVSTLAATTDEVALSGGLWVSGMREVLAEIKKAVTVTLELSPDGRRGTA